MIKYEGTKHNPPAPVINITITVPDSSTSRDISGLIDTGGDGTLIPMSIIDDLNLQPVGEWDILDFEGTYVGTKTTYSANISLGDINFDLIAVAPFEDEEAMIGRDIINELTILLKGKEQIFEITDP
ncbi:MAG: hypothetical protein L6243_07140 [Candidatus Altiarchaeales archaeon]|nr:hypothetical protein [Candidatus Altiarchaeota archaeon]MCG2783346.1 hypothetical protein [Candidatus Altiarchaeales archaeon]